MCVIDDIRVESNNIDDRITAELEDVKVKMRDAGISDKDIDAVLKPIESSLQRKVCGLIWDYEHTDTKKTLDKMNGKLPVFIREDAMCITGGSINNLLIEGDNLYALLGLQYTHIDDNKEGKVGVIYIDPPYNTNENFTYTDKYEKSEWLSILNVRLRLAYRLLAKNGFLCISLDDTFQAHAKLLLDEIFGAENFVACCPRKTSPSVTTKSDHELQKLHDYLIIYVKSDETKFNQKIVGEKTYPYHDERGDYYLVPLQDNGPHGTRTARPNLWYPIYQTPDGRLVLERESDADIEYLPKKHKGDEGCWMWSTKKFISDNQDLAISDTGEVSIKHYHVDGEETNKYQAEKTWLDEYLNKKGTEALKHILPDQQLFDYPKPVDLIKWCINLHPENDITVLDFYGGSGTTAQAVMELNNEDDGCRNFIICTNNEIPEKTAKMLYGPKPRDKAKQEEWKQKFDAFMTNEDNGICRGVTQKRIKGVIRGYHFVQKVGKSEKEFDVEGLSDNNLYYYKIDESSAQADTNGETIELIIDKFISYVSIKENCFDLDTKDKYVSMNNKIAVVTDYNMSVHKCKKLFNGSNINKVYCHTDKDHIEDGIHYVPYPQEIIDKLDAVGKDIANNEVH